MNSNQKKLAWGLMTIGFSSGLYSTTALALTCISSNCEALGYDKSANKCIGNYLLCPFDTTKAACKAKEKSTCADYDMLDYEPDGQNCTVSNPETGLTCYTSCSDASRCEAYNMLDKEPDDQICSVSTPEAGLTCYTSCSPAPMTCAEAGGYDAIPYGKICTPKTLKNGKKCYIACHTDKTCTDYGYVADNPAQSGYTCEVKQIATPDGDTLKCYNQNNCNKATLTKSQCLAKYPLGDDRCGTGCKLCGTCYFPSNMQKDDPECMQYSEFENCPCDSW